MHMKRVKCEGVDPPDEYYAELWQRGEGAVPKGFRLTLEGGEQALYERVSSFSVLGLGLFSSVKETPEDALLLAHAQRHHGLLYADIIQRDMFAKGRHVKSMSGRVQSEAEKQARQREKVLPAVPERYRLERAACPMEDAYYEQLRDMLGCTWEEMVQMRTAQVRLRFCDGDLSRFREMHDWVSGWRLEFVDAGSEEKDELVREMVRETHVHGLVYAYMLRRVSKHLELRHHMHSFITKLV